MKQALPSSRGGLLNHDVAEDQHLVENVLHGDIVVEIEDMHLQWALYFYSVAHTSPEESYRNDSCVRCERVSSR